MVLNLTARTNKVRCYAIANVLARQIDLFTA